MKAGQLLGEIDTGAVVRARLAEARADLETARREAVAATSLADEACVLADVASRQSRRKTELLGRGLASSEEAELARGGADAGAASCAARRAAARVSESTIAAAEARTTRYQAEIERSLVRAPFAGRVLDVHARPGELVGLEGLVEFGRVDSMYAIAEVYETDIRNVRKWQRASDSTATRSPATLSGTVERIRPKVQKLDEIGTDPAARKDARIVEVEIRLDDSKAAANLTEPAGRDRNRSLTACRGRLSIRPLGWLPAAGTSHAPGGGGRRNRVRRVARHDAARLPVGTFRKHVALPRAIPLRHRAVQPRQRVHRASARRSRSAGSTRRWGSRKSTAVSPVYIFPAVWKNPWNNERRGINVARRSIRRRHRSTRPDSPKAGRCFRSRTSCSSTPRRGRSLARLRRRSRRGSRSPPRSTIAVQGRRAVRDRPVVRHRRHRNHERRQLAAAVPGPPPQPDPARPDQAADRRRPDRSVTSCAPSLPGMCWS